jgi:hypothetical protein
MQQRHSVTSHSPFGESFFHSKQKFTYLLGLALWTGLVTTDCHAQAPPELIPRSAIWRYSADGSRQPEHWNLATFDDSAWKTGAAGFGYGDDDDHTVLEDMQNRYAAVCIRKTFTVERADDIESLFLYVNFDDGFIAYLNGKRVASAGVHGSAGELRIDQHEAQGDELFEIPSAKSLLKRGVNVLAIEGHNATLDSSDFSLDPFLTTDGFLNAFASLPHVSIVGEPSSGGSGATRQFQLPKTRVNLALSSMASFRPNGRLFDGNGIEVDIAVKPKLEDFTTGTDTVLVRGIAVIHEKTR